MATIAPRKTPWQFGFASVDTHIVVSGLSNEAKFYDYGGSLLYKCPALCVGQSPDWQRSRGDTPPGLYRLGEVWRDYSVVGRVHSLFEDATLRSYGWFTFDMVDLEGNEDGYGRAGIAIHGGGSANGWPGAWEPKQPLHPTHGCIRMHNEDLLTKVLPRYDAGKVFVSVYQKAR